MLSMKFQYSYNPCLYFLSLFQLSTAKNEINFFNNHILIVAHVTFAPADATPPSVEFCLFHEMTSVLHFRYFIPLLKIQQIS